MEKAKAEVLMKNTAKQLLLKALEASNPAKLIEAAVYIEDNELRVGEESREIPDPNNIFIIAVGKAARAMTLALKGKLMLSTSNILCITPEGNSKEAFSISSSHPVPDQKSIAAGAILVDFVKSIPEGSLVFFALSGGASALICKPAEGMKLEDINKMNQVLLESGATIEEINSVRKHLSAIKGGQLLNYFKNSCTLIDLVISDVPGDNLEIIGSGPTTPDSSTFQDAYDTLLGYDLWDECPQSIRKHLEKGLNGALPETIKPGDDPLRNHQSYIIGSARKLAEKIAQMVQGKGYKPWIAKEPYNQPVEEVAEIVATKIKDIRETLNCPAALIFYGESTVEVTGEGKGGRNQELALRGALKIKNMDNITWLSAGTDGIDGPTDAAGAIVDGSTIRKAEQQRLDASEYIKNNDSYHFHEQMGTLLKTGSTGNNVMDIVLILSE